MNTLYDELLKVEMAVIDVHTAKSALKERHRMYRYPGYHEMLGKDLLAVEVAESVYTLTMFEFCQYALASQGKK